MAPSSPLLFRCLCDPPRRSPASEESGIESATLSGESIVLGADAADAGAFAAASSGAVVDATTEEHRIPE